MNLSLHVKNAHSYLVSENPVLNDGSFIFLNSSITIFQGISLESLSCEDLCTALRLPSDQLDQEVDSKPDQFNNLPDNTQPTEFINKNFVQKGKKKKRKRTVSTVFTFSTENKFCRL